MAPPAPKKCSPFLKTSKQARTFLGAWRNARLNLLASTSLPHLLCLIFLATDSLPHVPQFPCQQFRCQQFCKIRPSWKCLIIFPPITHETGANNQYTPQMRIGVRGWLWARKNWILKNFWNFEKFEKIKNLDLSQNLNGIAWNWLNWNGIQDFLILNPPTQPFFFIINTPPKCG